MENEIWRNIEEYKGIYQVSNHGRVKSLGNNKTRKEKILKPSIDKYGYYNVNLRKNNINKKIRVHRLVALSFIPNPEDKPQVNHISGNKLCNNVSNLEFCSQQENMKHALILG